jgi:hypothetical protein
MRTEYRYIRFVKIADKPKTSVWSCRNIRSNAELGLVRWHPAWRQYCYFPTAQAVYSAGCLVDINDFMLTLGADHGGTTG